jgi:hypothetical protein
MLISANQELTVDQAKAPLGPPPLMLGESEEEYWKWWTAFVEPDKPKRFFAWLELNELAHKEWEQKRLRHCRSALVKRVMISALYSILLSFHDGGVQFATARDYFGNDERKQREARNIVASYGITDEQIVAEAMAKRGGEMLVLDRMDNNRAGASRQLRRAIERRAESYRTPSQ